MKNKVYALLASGEIVEGTSDPKGGGVSAIHKGGHSTLRPMFVTARTTDNYERLVALFGNERVPNADIENDPAKEYMAQRGTFIGMVSNESCKSAKESGDYFAVKYSGDATKPFYAVGEFWTHCVAYDQKLREIKPAVKRPELKAGDYVMGASDDLHGIEAREYKVFFDGAGFVVFDNNGDALPILEQLELGHFDRIEKE